MAGPFGLTDGEVHFLWWFIQGSIMNPETRQVLRLCWGFCGRHAWGALSVEMGFRRRHLLGPAILYRDLVERAVVSIQARRWPAGQKYPGLRTRGPCLLCDLAVGWAPSGPRFDARIAQGRNVSELMQLVKDTRPYWEDQVCAACCKTNSQARCRVHLLAELRDLSGSEIAYQRQLLRRTLARLDRLERSFLSESRRSASPDEWAGLITAIGWCSGWTPLLKFLKGPE